MTKKELIKKIAEVNKTSISKTEEFYNSFENTLIKAIISNEEVSLSSKIGKFKLKSRKAYTGRNPKTRKKTKNTCQNRSNFQTCQNHQRPSENFNFKITQLFSFKNLRKEVLYDIKQKIYLSLIGLLSLGFLILLIFGITHSRPPTKNPSLTKKPPSTQQQEVDHQIKLE
ncbi:hypothetical protein PAWBP_6830 [Paulownia witches'-broom phytoplasma]|nr:hypothetical protein PAWBP_6830 [Paulownia witches'-broom phytoplasma]